MYITSYLRLHTYEISDFLLRDFQLSPKKKFDDGWARESRAVNLSVLFAMARTTERRRPRPRVYSDSNDSDEEGSVDAGRPKMVFKDKNDEPICFMFHTSVVEERKRELEAKITVRIISWLWCS